MQCSAKTSMRSATTKVTRQAAAVAQPIRRSRVVKVSAVKAEQAAAAAAAAVMLAASPVIASELPTAAVLNPTAEVAVSGKIDVDSIGSKINKFFDKAYLDPTSKINEDPFAADRKQGKTVADTKKSMPIPTEQEAVAPEAFPNPAGNIYPEPPVLSSAAGDEQYGPNAGQFKGLTEGDRQGLIDAKSPAQASKN